MTRPSNSLKSLWLTLLPAACCFVLCVGIASSARAQETTGEAFFETLAQAEARTGAKQWKEAAALWEQVVRVNPVRGEYWNQLASAYYNAKDFRRSIPAYEKSLELGHGDPANAAYNIACNYALLGDREAALRWLERAFELKFLNLEHARTDSDLESIRNDARYRKLVGMVDTGKMSRDEGWRYDLAFLAR